MRLCNKTGLTVPECSCSRCIQRQLEQFAPSAPSIRRAGHDPLSIRDVRDTSPLMLSAAERLSRPAL